MKKTKTKCFKGEEKKRNKGQKYPFLENGDSHYPKFVLRKVLSPI